MSLLRWPSKRAFVYTRVTLQGAKKNSSRKASTFRQVTKKRTCERGGGAAIVTVLRTSHTYIYTHRVSRTLGSRKLTRAYQRSVCMYALCQRGVGKPSRLTSSLACLPSNRLANVDDFTSFDGQVRSLGECQRYIRVYRYVIVFQKPLHRLALASTLNQKIIFVCERASVSRRRWCPFVVNTTSTSTSTTTNVLDQSIMSP